MSAINAYFENLTRILDEVQATQSAALEEGAKLLCEATLTGHNIFAFGCSHAGLLALELYYRTGGMANINPVRGPGLCCDVDPATMTSEIERLPGYGAILANNQPIGAGDVVIVHSVSGRNAVPVDFAHACREKGAKVIVLTNLTYSKGVTSRAPSGKRLFEEADLVLDNCGCPGDSALDIKGVPEKVAPTSTAVGSAMVNAMMARAVELITEAGGIAPIFMSANLDGGDEHNKKMLEKYKDHIFYMGH